MNILQNIITKAQTKPQKIVLAEGEDKRIIEAAANAHQHRIAEIYLLGNDEKIRQQARALGVSLDGIKIIDPTTSKLAIDYAKALYKARKHKGMSLEKAEQLVLDPLYFGMMMIYQGDADGGVCGAVYSSADVVRSALQLIGMQANCKLVSSCFLMIMDKPFHTLQNALIFADCALNISPDAQQLAQIAIASAQTAKLLLEEEPSLAMLSFSTNNSAQSPLIDKVIKATELVFEQYPEIKIIGEVQLDAALIPAIYQQKAANKPTPDSAANVLIFPNIEAGNIGYKIAERIGQAQAIGPILQGLNNPVNDLSRGCNAQDIFNVIAITAVQCASGT